MRRIYAALGLLVVATSMAVGVSAQPAWAAPSCPPGLALDDVASGDAVSGQLVCDDPSGTGLNFAVTSQAAHGFGDVDGVSTVTYYSDSGYLGPDGFTVTVSDNDGGSVTVQVSVQVVGNHQPACQPLVLSDVRPGASVSATPSCSDVDGDSLSYRIVSPPAHGVASVATGPVVTYTAGPSLSGGTETFTFAASDGAQESTPQTASVHVLSDAAPACVSLTMPSGGSPVDVPLACIDPEGDPFVLSIVEGPADGAGTLGPVDQSRRLVRFSPAAGFSGTALIRYRATDQLGAGSETATVTVPVTPTPTGDSPGCTAARQKLTASLHHLKRLVRAHASHQRIARAKKKVKQAKKLVAAACG